MKVKISGVRKIFIKSEYIKLDALLKFSSIASTGGEAKVLIQGADVYVGGKPCLERGRKIRPGDVVRCRGETLVVEIEPLLDGNCADQYRGAPMW